MREEMWDTHAKARLGGTRAAIETAREAVTAMQRRRGGAGEAGRHAVIRLEASEQLLAALIALGDTLQGADTRQRDVAAAVLDRLQRTQLLFAQAIVADSTASNPEIEQSIAAIASEASSLPVADPVRTIVGQIVERLRIAYTLAVPANFLPGAAPDGTPLPLRRRLLQPLRCEPGLAITGISPCAAPGGHGRAGARLHHAVVHPVRPLADDHHRDDDAAVFRADLYACTGSASPAPSQADWSAALVGVVCTTPLRDSPWRCFRSPR